MAKKIVKKYRNLSRTKPYQKFSSKKKQRDDNDDVAFLKKIPVHPRDRLARKTRDEVKFVKQVPLHSRERLKRKIKLENYAHLNKKSKNEDITFIKQVPLHLRERLKRLDKINKKVDLVNEIGKTKKILIE